MGRGMAKNLLEKGHAVVAFDTDSMALKDTVALGAKEATSPKVWKLVCISKKHKELSHCWILRKMRRGQFQSPNIEKYVLIFD